MNRIRKRKSNYTSVSNGILRDNRLSFKAKGLFCYMYSMSEEWNFTLQSIATQQRDGLDSIKTAMNELKKYEYITYEKHSNGKGTYSLEDEPKVENPHVENPKLGKSTCIKKEKLVKNNKLEEKNTKKDLVLNMIEEKSSIALNKQALIEWVEYKKYNYKKIGITKIVNMLTSYSHKQQQEIVDASIMNGYQGLFPPKQSSITQTKSERTNKFIDDYFDKKDNGEFIYEC